MKKIIFALILAITSTATYARMDLSAKFLSVYHQKKEFTQKELNRLKQYDIYFIPGILAESLVRDDNRSSVDLSYITKDYFSEQIKLLQNKYKLRAFRLSTSSYNVEETQQNIRNAVYNAQQKNRKVLLVSHSLGGLALLEELVKNPQIQEGVAGIAFLQSPFFGSHLADVLKNPPYHLERVLHPLLPYLNISMNTIDYVAPESRTAFMNNHKAQIQNLINKVPLYTFSSSVPANRSALKPLIDIMTDGCFKGVHFGCISEVFYHGPYDESDGFIPVKSSFIPGADFVFLKNVDHAEIILKFPFEDYEKEHLTTTWLRVLLDKIK